MGKPGPDRKVTDVDVLTAIMTHYAPAVGTSDVADEVGISRQAVDKYLWDLEEDGLIRTRRVGQARVWWLTDDGKEWLYENRT